jgi:hypothetical protein
MTDLTIIPGDLDATITANTPEVQTGQTPIDDEMRDAMRAILNPNLAVEELTFTQRKVALLYGWL